MPQLRSCYFCGSVGDSLREYEVVPERLVDPGGSRSAVLCSTCQEKLRRVLDPLVEAAESPAGGPDPGVSVGEVTFESADDTSEAVDGRDGGADETITVTERETDPENGDEDDVPDDDVPDGYYKVLRLLQNREFPMERDDLTAIVTGAYDVTEPQCERILKTAIDRGVLVEDGSTLDVGRD
jgi:hypothetical protein